MSRDWIAGLTAVCRAECDLGEYGSIWVVELEAGQLLDTVRELWDRGYFLEDVMGADLAEGIQAIYHFDHWDNPGRITLKIMLPHENPAIPTISTIYGGALWHERECFDFYGIDFVGHPDLKPLLLPDDQPLRPLIKDAARRSSVYKVIPFCQMVDCGAGQPESRTRGGGK